MALRYEPDYSFQKLSFHQLFVLFVSNVAVYLTASPVKFSAATAPYPGLTLLQTKQKTSWYHAHTILCQEQDNTFVKNTAQKKKDRNTLFMQIHSTLYFYANGSFFNTPTPRHLASY